MTNGSYEYRILTPTELRNPSSNTLYDKNNPRDCNEILSNLAKDSKLCDNLNPFESGYLNMQPIRNLYLHSSTLGNYNSIGPDGCQTIIKKYQWLVIITLWYLTKLYYIMITTIAHNKL